MKVKIVKADSLQDLDDLINGWSERESHKMFYVDISLVTYETHPEPYCTQFNNLFVATIKFN